MEISKLFLGISEAEQIAQPPGGLKCGQNLIFFN
nr:MAG TPA: hypothetical protein [Caudoviricetes sp.]